MNGVYFGEKHSFNDFGLILSKKDIGVPEIKRMEVEVPGANGILDLTEALTGSANFKNRKLSFTFSVPDPGNRWLTTFSQVMNYLHGKNMKVIIDEDPGYFYLGRVSVNKIQSQKRIGKIVIDVNAAPYKYNVQSSDEDWKWDPFCFIDGYIQKTVYNVPNDGLTVTIKHHGEVVVPEFITPGVMMIMFKGKTYLTTAGTYKNYEIFFEDGDNEITFVGEGTWTVQIRGGSL